MKYTPVSSSRSAQSISGNVTPIRRRGSEAEEKPQPCEGASVDIAEIILGMARNEFFLVYQPQFSIGGDGCTLSGVEALIRWNHPRLGRLLPGQFLPEVESSELECELGEYVLQAAVSQVQAWLSTMSWSPRVAINMSGPQLGNPTLCSDILRTLGSASVATRYLEVEVLESAAIRNSERTAHELQGLRESGVAVAIDDFGTGFASLQYLLKFPLDTIKICSSFVHGIGHGTGADEICQAIIQLGRSLGKRVIAEGVETTQQLDFLRSNLCKEAQGFLLARPMADDAFTESFMKPRARASQYWH